MTKQFFKSGKNNCSEAKETLKNLRQYSILINSGRIPVFFAGDIPKGILRRIPYKKLFEELKMKFIYETQNKFLKIKIQEQILKDYQNDSRGYDDDDV